MKLLLLSAILCVGLVGCGDGKDRALLDVSKKLSNDFDEDLAKANHCLETRNRDSSFYYSGKMSANIETRTYIQKLLPNPR